MAKLTSRQINAFLESKCDITSWRDGKTWREWFANCLEALVSEGEGFSGKRPNCDSAWPFQMAAGLSRLEPKIVSAWEPSHEDDEPAWPHSVNWRLMNTIAAQVIRHLCGLSKGSK